MSETAENEDVGGGGHGEEEAMRKKHKKESGVSPINLLCNLTITFSIDRKTRSPKP